MTKRISTILLAAVLAAAAQPPLRLADVRRTVQAGQVEEARAAHARSQMRYLQAMNRTRVEFRPALSLLSFSNPWLLAANLGAGISINRRTAPTHQMLESAAFDVLEADLAVERARTRAQSAAVKAFYDVLIRQETRALFSQAVEQGERDLAQVGRLVKAGRVTALEQAATEQQLIDLKIQALDAEAGRRASAAALAELLGRPQEADSLLVADEPGEDLVKAALPSSDALFSLALRHRPDARVLRERLEALRGRTAGRRVAGVVEGVSAGYSYLANKSGNRPADWLLGGNVGSLALNLNVPLKPSAENEAWEQVRLTRLRLLEEEEKKLHEELKAEIRSSYHMALAASARLELMQRRSALARDRMRMVAARHEGGLESDAALLSARLGETESGTLLIRASHERRSAMYVLLALCGVERQPELLQAADAAAGGGNQ
jgi:outer membrane protein TolC